MVFHPRYFLTSAFFARFLLDLDLSGKRVADVGTGSGILALAAARAGAASVLALDINPHAAQAAVENAHSNGFGDSISAIGSNLLSAVTPLPGPLLPMARLAQPGAIATRIATRLRGTG